MFKKKKTPKEEKRDELEELFEDFSVNYYYDALVGALQSEGYVIKCLKIKKIDRKAVSIEDC